MTKLKIVARILMRCMFFVGIATPVCADIWDEPQNIEVLSKDISPDELRATMRGFAMATGSRCSGCHVAEDESDFSTFDFTLDDKEKKIKAREMIRMVAEINSRLARAFEKPPEQMVQVDCSTCHRGQARPEKIQTLLANAYREKGMQEALAEYQDLRDRYYGGYTFDFSERALMILAEQLADEHDVEGALGFLNLNLKHYPRSAGSYVLQGQVHAASGDKAAARRSYQQAMDIEPSPWTQQLLDGLEQE